MPDSARDKAWTLLMANLLVLPGLGTWLGGRKASGAAQMALALAGFALILAWLVSWGMMWARLGQMPDGLGPQGSAGLAGIGLFVVAWGWSLSSGLGLYR